MSNKRKRVERRRAERRALKASGQLPPPIVKLEPVVINLAELCRTGMTRFKIQNDKGRKS